MITATHGLPLFSLDLDDVIILPHTHAHAHTRYIASFPLLAHARAFPEKPGDSFSFVNGQ